MTDVTPPASVAPGTQPILVARPATPVERGPALCLSGGGFRATLFHLGSLRRLNELGVLAHLDTITSVSGGSILNGVLATRWSDLTLGANGFYTNFENVIARPVRAFCGRDLRTGLLCWLRLDPANWGVLMRDFFSVSANYLAEAYEPLYRKRLSELPAPGAQTPRFIFCSINVKTGVFWNFHGGPRARMGDFYTGYCDAGQVRVSEAVAASSAFPLGFSALRMQLPDDCAFSREDPWGENRVASAKRGDQLRDDPVSPLILTDGGVYDNLGVQSVWGKYKTILASDAGRPFESISRNEQCLVPRLRRVSEISAEQAGALRKRWLVEQFQDSRRPGGEVKRQGVIWAIDTLLADYPVTGRQGYSLAARKLLLRVRTDLNAFTEGEIACLENHGYSLADAALRCYAASLCPNINAPYRWPHERWQDEDRLRRALGRSHRASFVRDILQDIRHTFSWSRCR